ncbi:MAG: glycosyltransferase, partial [Eggerthella lenta]
VKLSLINEKPPKMLAVVIAAWHEDAVLGEVVDNLVASAQYPRSLYRVFLGVYPNDAATVAVARTLEARHGGTVVCVVGDDPGPTSKAANINHTVRAIREYEAERDVRFASVTIHDAEDVVHPNEFKMTNYLIDDYDALQFPVFPLQRMPRLRLFFKTLTSTTYADEFAEHHFRTMVMRDELGFVPSAGTGFAIGRRVLDAFRDEDLLPRNSLTEDYKLSLTLRMRGFRVHYVLEKVPRVDARGRTVWDYIATRSLFPSTFKAAVRQKARWVYGITMQSASMADVFGKSELTFAERTFLYKDLKAKFANFVLLPGYAVLAYFLVQTLAPRLQLPVMYP